MNAYVAPAPSYMLPPYGGFMIPAFHWFYFGPEGVFIGGVN